MAFDLVGKAVKNLRLPTVNYDHSPVKIILAQEGDVNSRYFSVTLYDDRGDIPVSEYSKVTLNATLPDESLQLAEGEINAEENVAVCKIAGSMLKQLGKVTCDIVLTGTDSNGDAMSLTSQTFYVFVAKSQAGDDAIEGSDDYTLLVQLLNEVSELEESVETAEAARANAETARVNAEAERVTNENTRKSNETARITAEQSRASAETTRVANENARKTAETARAEAEAARVKAEEDRVAEYDQISGELGEVIDNINAAAENAKKVEELYNKMEITFFYDEEGYVCYEDKTTETA